MIEIDIKPKIFDDPEYCRDEYNSSIRCSYLGNVSYDEEYCWLTFRKLKSSSVAGKWTKVNKCQQCKESYQRAKSYYTPDRFLETLERRK